MSKRTDEGTMAEDDPTSGADTPQKQIAQRHYEPNGQVEHERLQDRDAAASLDVEQRDAVAELRQQHLVRSGIGLVSKGPIAVCAPCRLVHRQSVRR